MCLFARERFKLRCFEKGKDRDRRVVCLLVRVEE